MDSREADASIETWACLPDDVGVYSMPFPSKEAALAALEGRSGEVVRYTRGVTRHALENFFAAGDVIERAHETLLSNTFCQDEDGNFLARVLPSQQRALEQRLGDALYEWLSEVNPPVWTVLEVEAVELPTNA